MGRLSPEVCFFYYNYKFLRNIYLRRSKRSSYLFFSENIVFSHREKIQKDILFRLESGFLVFVIF